MKRYIRCSSESSDRPVTESDIKSLVQAYKQIESDHKVRLSPDGQYLRWTAYEDDYVTYSKVTDIVSGLAQDRISYGEALEDPSLIFEYYFDRSFAHHGFEYQDYREFKQEMNAKCGFSRQRKAL